MVPDLRGGDYVLKFPVCGALDHPEAEPELCAFLRAHGIPACAFLQNNAGRYLSQDGSGRVFTVQRRFPGTTPDWNTASEALLLESAELAWRIGLMERFPAWRFDLNRLTCRNTHGDYFISQFLCEDGHLTAVIDWTTACIHPVIWELMRSFVYAAPCCADGSIDRSLLARCVHAYCRYGTLNDYDLKNLERLYLYQIAVCDYYGQYYASAAANRHIYLQPAQHATHLLRQVFG